MFICALDGGHGITDLMFVLLGFKLVLISCLSCMIPSLHLEGAIFILVHHVSEVYSLLLILLIPTLQRDFEHVLLSCLVG